MFAKRNRRGDQDLWGQHLQNLIRNCLGAYALSLITWRFHMINVRPSSHPIYDNKGKAETFWRRTP